MDKIIEKPEVTVLMSVYNGQDYLRESIESILNQAFSNFEFLIIDDGSTDKTADIVSSYADKRIKYVSNETNKGLPFSLNRGLELAKGEYIARMDHDDISLPERLEKQVKFMKSHPEIAVCGTWVKTIEPHPFTNKYYTQSEDIKASLLFNTSMAHPSVMLRKSFLTENHLQYESNFKYFEEDYNLWVEISKSGLLYNLPEVLVLYRIHEKSATQVNVENRQTGVSEIRKKQVERLGFSPTAEEMAIHNNIRPEPGEDVDSFLRSQEKWLLKLIHANEQYKIYRKESLLKVIYKRWYTVCGLSTKHGLGIWKIFVESPLFHLGQNRKLLDYTKMYVKSLTKN